MAVELVLSTAENALVIRNLYPLYMHDLSAFLGEPPNAHGADHPALRFWRRVLTPCGVTEAESEAAVIFRFANR